MRKKSIPTLILLFIISISLVSLVSLAALSSSYEIINNTVNMLLWYKFDEAGGSFIQDSSGNANNAEIIGGEGWSSGKIDGAVNLTGVNYIQLPVSIVKDLNDFTITAWVNQSVVYNWQRLLDFGNDITKYMYFTLNDGAGSRFALNNNNNWHEFSGPSINDPMIREYGILLLLQ